MYFSKRLPHVVTRQDLAILLIPTYAAGRNVDEDEAHERLGRAVASPSLQEELYFGLSEGLRLAQGTRTTEDALMDKLSKAIAGRRSRAKAVEATPPIAALLVRVDLEI